MNKVKLNPWIDIIQFTFFLSSAFSGVVLRFLLPAGYGSLRGSELVFLGFSRGEWKDIHYYSNVVFVSLIIIHLLLHSSYIKNLPKLLKGGG